MSTLEDTAHISNSEVVQDIRDTQSEVATLRRRAAIIALEIEDREAFIDKLKKLLADREKKK